MPHPALPDNLTKENLGVWISENQIDQLEHIEETPLTPEKITELEHKSSVAPRSILNLEEVKNTFMEKIKKGTMVNTMGEPEPESVTIPPTVGLAILEKRRIVAEETIKSGVEREVFQVFGIPYPEEEKICFFSSDGTPYPSHDYPMNPEQQEKYGLPLFKTTKDGGGGEQTGDFFEV